jgi:hypothetical protein
LQLDSTVRNDGPGPASLLLPDRATLVLAVGAAIAVRTRDRVDLHRGAALIRTSRPLRIEAGDVRAEVLGTELALERTGAGVALHVLSGSVRLVGPRGDEIVGAGQRTFCPHEQRPTGAEAASPWTALGWLGEPRLVFRTLEGSSDEVIDLEILVETDSPEILPLRPFSEASGDFVLLVQAPDGSRFP